MANVLGVSTDYLLGLSDSSLERTDDTLRLDERKLLDAYSVGDSATIMELVSARLRQLSKNAAE
jgi:hypothetical protein